MGPRLKVYTHSPYAQVLAPFCAPIRAWGVIGVFLRVREIKERGGKDGKGKAGFFQKYKNTVWIPFPFILFILSHLSQ